MSNERAGAPEAWWLLATPVACTAVGTVVGAVLGAAEGLLGRHDEVGPFVGDPVASGLLGAVVGLAIGVLAGSALGIVSMFVVGRGRARSAARWRAGTAAAVVCPAVLSVVMVVSRADGGPFGAVGFASVAALGVLTAVLLVGRAPDGAGGTRSAAGTRTR